MTEEQQAALEFRTQQNLAKGAAERQNPGGLVLRTSPDGGGSSVYLLFSLVKKETALAFDRAEFR